MVGLLWWGALVRKTVSGDLCVEPRAVLDLGDSKNDAFGEAAVAKF